MAEKGENAGSVSLELLLNSNTISEQFKNVESSAKRPAEQAGETLENAMSRPFESMGNSLKERAESAMQKIRKVLENSELSSDPTGKLVQKLYITQEKIQELGNKWKELRTRLESENLSSQQIEEINVQMTKLEQEMLKLSETADGYNTKINKSFNADRVSVYEEKLRSLKAESAEKIKAIEEQSAERISAIKEQNAEKVKALQQKIEQQSEKLSKKHSESIKSSFGKAFKSLKSVGGKALDSLKRKFGVLNKSAGTVAKPVEKLGRMLKNSFRRVFLMATMYAGVKALKNSLGEALKANQEFSDSLNEVKANLSIAFAPIMQAVMPAINSMMSGLAVLTKQIAGFISGLFGMTYKQASDTAQKLKNTAKTAQDTAKKVQMSTAGIDEMNILSDGSESGADSKKDEESGIDYSKIDMNEPELPDWAEHLKNAIKAGDWNGVGKALAEKVNSVFEGIDWEKIESRFRTGAEKVSKLLNGLFDNVNWSALGEGLAGGINTITGTVNTLAESLHFENFGINIARGLNTAIQKVKWTQLGKALSAKIKVLTDILHRFVTVFDWKGLGKGIGDAVNGWFDGIDFTKIAVTLSTGIKGIFDSITSFLDRVNFGGIGSKFAGFINNIDVAGILKSLAESVNAVLNGLLDLLISLAQDINWSKLGQSIWNGIVNIIEKVEWTKLIEKVFELLGSAVGGLSSLAVPLIQKVWGVLKNAWEKTRALFDKEIQECGGNIFAGILSGIIEAGKGILSWIKKHIFEPFINGFKKVFDIHSPSKVMAEMGGYIIDGLFNAISDGIAKIKSIFKKMLKAIQGIFENTDKWFSDKFGSAWENVKSAWNGAVQFFTNILNCIKGVYSAVGDWFRDRFREAWNNVKAVWDVAVRFFTDIWSSIKSVYTAVGNWFKDRFREAWDGITSIFCGIGSWFGDRWNDIANIFWQVGNWFSQRFWEAWNGITGVFNGIGTWFGSKWEEIRNVFSSTAYWFWYVFQSAYNSITAVFQNLGGFFSGIWSDVSNRARDGMNWLISRVEDGLNRIIDGLNWFGFDLPEVMGGGHVGFSIGHVGLPRLAKGGLATAPTLALVGDNPHAHTDPEVISPLSKLKGLNDNSETVELMNVLINLLQGGISAEIKGDMKRVILKTVADDRIRRGY